MDARSSQQGLRQRVAQVFRWFRWLLTGKQTREQYRQSARYPADGVERGQQDPDATRRYVTQQREAFERQKRQKGWGRGR